MKLPDLYNLIPSTSLILKEIKYEVHKKEKLEA